LVTHDAPVDYQGSGPATDGYTGPELIQPIGE
jgi:hypothetical protein